MVKPLRHRQTKGAATDMFYLTPPRHISTLPFASFPRCTQGVRFTPDNGHAWAAVEAAQVPPLAPCYHNPLKSSGTSPNSRNTVASRKLPVAGSPVRLTRPHLYGQIFSKDTAHALSRLRGLSAILLNLIDAILTSERAKIHVVRD